MIWVYSFLSSIVLLMFFFSIMRFNSNIANIGVCLMTLIPPFVGPLLSLILIFVLVVVIQDRTSEEILKNLGKRRTLIFAQNNRLAHWMFNTAVPESFYGKSQMINE